MDAELRGWDSDVSVLMLEQEVLCSSVHDGQLRQDTTSSYFKPIMELCIQLVAQRMRLQSNRANSSGELFL